MCLLNFFWLYDILDKVFVGVGRCVSENYLKIIWFFGKI